MHYSPEIFDDIVNLLPGYVYWKDKNHVYLGCNHLQAKTLGLSSRQDIVGKTDHELVWKDQADEFKRVEQQVIETGVAVTVEENLAVAGNPHAAFISKKTPIRNEQGAIMGVMGVSIDITKQMQRQEELLDQAKRIHRAANQAKTDFIHNVEHDIRTPFAGIISVAEFLHQQEQDQLKRESLQEIQASAKQLLTYLNEVLEVSYQTSGDLPQGDQKLDLRGIITDLIAIQKPSASAKKLKLLYDMPNDLPEVMMSDHYRVERVLLNLISNAIKFTDKGYIQISVDVMKRVDLKNIILRLTVEDSGIGIAPEHLDRIFDKFYRVNPSYQGVYGGTGLGLYLTQQFVDELSGEIQVESELGKGSQFTVLLPVKLPLMQDDNEFQFVALESL